MIRRLLPLSGSLAVASAVVAFVALGGSTPDGKASAGKVTSFYLAHHGRQSAAAFVLSGTAVLLLLFAGALWEAIPASPWRFVLGLGAAVAASGFLGAAAIHLALAEGVHDGISGSAAQALNALDANFYLPFAIGLATMFVGAAGAWIPQRGVERVLGWCALLLAITAFTPAGFAAFMLAGVWLVVASVALTVRGTDAAAPARAQAVLA